MLAEEDWEVISNSAKCLRTKRPTARATSLYQRKLDAHKNEEVNETLKKFGLGDKPLESDIV